MCDVPEGPTERRAASGVDESGSSGTARDEAALQRRPDDDRQVADGEEGAHAAGSTDATSSTPRDLDEPGDAVFVDDRKAAPSDEGSDPEPQGDAAGGEGPADEAFTEFLQHVRLVTGSVTIVSGPSRPVSRRPKGMPAPDVQVRDGSAVPGPRAEEGAPARWASRSVRTRLRDRFRADVIGLAVLAALVLLCAGLIAAIVVKTERDEARAAREAAGYTAGPPSSAAPSSTVPVPVVAVVGDESVTSAAGGISADRRWPRRLADATGARVLTFAAAGAGYIAAGEGGDDYTELAAKVPAGATAVVLMGGAADADASSLSLARAATEAIAAVTTRAPDATVFVVGPLFVPEGTTSRQIATVRASLQSAASIADVRFVDPVQSAWLPSRSATSRLTAADQQTISSKVRAALGASIS